MMLAPLPVFKETRGLCNGVIASVRLNAVQIPLSRRTWVDRVKSLEPKQATFAWPTPSQQPAVPLSSFLIYIITFLKFVRCRTVRVFGN